MNFSPDTRLALHPQLVLKNDVDRAVLITRSKPLSDRDYIFRRLHPSEAIILALLDGRRNLAETGETWAELTDEPLERAHADVERVVDIYTSGERARDRIMIEVDESNQDQVRQYDPMDYVIPAAKVNLKDRRLRRPHNIHYLPTLFCPQKCIYCYAKVKTHPEPPQELLSLERLREILDEVVSIGVETIQMSGGDPFARQDILDILKAILDAGLVPDIPTKLGISLEKARRLRGLGLDSLQVSLDSTQPAILDKMVGVNNYHRRAFRVIEGLKEAGFEVRVNAVLTPYNVATAGSLIDFLGRLGHVVQLSLSPYGRSLFCHQDALFVEEEDLQKVEEEIALRRELYPHMRTSVGFGGADPSEDPEERRQEWQRRAFCTADRDGMVILPDGRVTVCEELYDHPEFIIGNVKEQSVMEVWESPRALALIHPKQADVPDGPCKTCPEFEVCNSDRGRCWRDVLKSYGWDKPHYPDPRCPWAPAGNRLG